MAKIYTETIVITINKLVKDDTTPDTVATDDVLSALASVAEELVGPSVVVEVERA
jgi:hypothetical protein